MILGSVVLLISLTSGDLEEHVQRPGTSFQGMVQQSQVALAARAVLAMPMDVTVITLWPAWQDWHHDTNLSRSLTRHSHYMWLLVNTFILDMLGWSRWSSFKMVPCRGLGTILAYSIVVHLPLRARIFWCDRAWVLQTPPMVIPFGCRDAPC